MHLRTASMDYYTSSILLIDSYRYFENDSTRFQTFSAISTSLHAGRGIEEYFEREDALSCENSPESLEAV